MPGFLNPGVPLLLIPEYSGINKGQRVPERSKTAHRKPFVKCFLIHVLFSCCFLTCIQLSQEAGQVVWYSHLFQNIPQFTVIHTVEGFGVVNKAELDVFLELSCFFDDPVDVGNLISGSSAFSTTSLNI